MVICVVLKIWSFSVSWLISYQCFRLKMLSAYYVCFIIILNTLQATFIMEANNVNPDQTILEQSDLGHFHLH